MCEMPACGYINGRHCEAQSAKQSILLPSGAMDCFASLAMTVNGEKSRLSLPFAAHEIEIATFVGLQNGLVEQMRVSALGPFGRLRRRQCGAAFFELGIVDQQIDAALGDIEPDHVAVLDQRQRTADGGFWGD